MNAISTLVPNVDDFLDEAERLQNRIAAHASIDSPNYPNFLEDFRWVCGPDIARFELGETGNAAFSYAGGTLVWNRSTISRILAAAAVDIEAVEKEQGLVLSDNERDGFYRIAVNLFMLHEFRHDSQGIGKYDNVQILKSTGGTVFLALLDLKADRDAAAALADMESSEQLDAENYLALFRRNIFLLGAIMLRAFDFPESNVSKLGRAISIVFMAARMSRSEQGANDSALFGQLPLDHAFFTLIAPSDNSLCFINYNHQYMARVTAEQVPDLIEFVINKNFRAAVELAAEMIQRTVLAQTP